MVSFESYVGFERKPAGLDAFLEAKGYILIETDAEGNKTYEHRKKRVDVYYFDQVKEAKEGEQPDWKRAGFKVICELNIITKEGKFGQEPERLATKIAKHYDGIVHDIQADEYLRKEDL